MIRMFVRHPVTDFAAWKQAYDDFDDERIGMGVAGDAVFQSASVLFQKYLVHNAMLSLATGEPAHTDSGTVTEVDRIEDLPDPGLALLPGMRSSAA